MDTRSVQENFSRIASFIQDMADKHIPSKTSRSVSSVPWITREIRTKIHRKNVTHAKVKKNGSAKIRSKFENLSWEIKADLRKQHDLYVNNLVGDVKANPRDFNRYINSQRKDTQGIPPLKNKNEMKVELLNQILKKQKNLMVSSQMYSPKRYTTKSHFCIGRPHSWTKVNPSKALGPDELHPRVQKKMAKELGPVFAHIFQQSINTGEIPKEWSLLIFVHFSRKVTGPLLVITDNFLCLVFLANLQNISSAQISWVVLTNIMFVGQATCIQEMA